MGRSEVGLGCWQLGGADWGNVSEAEASSILGAAVDQGVNVFDVADVYGGGRAEEILGRFLRGRRGLRVATKLGRTADLFPDRYTEAGLRRATEASLRRLGVEAVDLTQLHCVPTEVLRRGEVFGWLEQLRREGKILHYSASVESIEEAMICLGHEGVASLQVIFNLFRHRPARELFPAAAAKGVGLLVRLPLASGLLSGKFTKDTVFAAGDHRHYNRDGQKFNVGETFAGLPFEKGVELAGGLRPLVPPGWSMAQMAQRWILDFPEVSAIIPGASSAAQVGMNTGVSALAPLPEELHHSLEAFHTSRVAPWIRGPY